MTDSPFEDITITRIVTEKITEPRNDGGAGSALYSIPFALSQQPDSHWATLLVENWNHPQSFTMMHRPGIASVISNTIVLNGTTIDEVDKYHRETLMAAVEKTNRDYRMWLQSQEHNRARQEAASQENRRHVEDVASNIKFD